MKLPFAIVASFVAWSLTAACATAGGPFGIAPSQRQSTMAEQVIVRFTPGSAAQEVFAAALAGGPEATARVDALAASLSAELRLPLRIVRVTSGREFVLAIAADALAERLIEYLDARPDVQAARLLQPGDRTQQLHWNPVVEVEFGAGSHLGKALSGSASPEDLARNLEALTADVSNAVEFPVNARAPRPVEFTIDIRAVTKVLVERLEARPDVQYAQPDLLMQPMRGNEGRPKR